MGSFLPRYAFVIGELSGLRIRTPEHPNQAWMDNQGLAELASFSNLHRNMPG